VPVEEEVAEEVSEENNEMMTNYNYNFDVDADAVAKSWIKDDDEEGRQGRGRGLEHNMQRQLDDYDHVHVHDEMHGDGDDVDDDNLLLRIGGDNETEVVFLRNNSTRSVVDAVAAGASAGGGGVLADDEDVMLAEVRRMRARSKERGSDLQKKCSITINTCGGARMVLGGVRLIFIAAVLASIIVVSVSFHLAKNSHLASGLHPTVPAPLSDLTELCSRRYFDEVCIAICMYFASDSSCASFF
jgi:hypothetical protein